MSDEFRGLGARERAALEAALKRCRVLADQIESILRKERRFIDKVSLAEFSVALERAADVLGQESRKSVENTRGRALKRRSRRLEREATCDAADRDRWLPYLRATHSGRA
jgi:hypothetical protein